MPIYSMEVQYLYTFSELFSNIDEKFHRDMVNGPSVFINKALLVIMLYYYQIITSINIDFFHFY